MEWLLVVEIVLGLVVLSAIGFLFGMWARRRSLSSLGAVYDCALRLDTRTGNRWVLGMARYRGDELLWYRVFSLSPLPQLQLSRNSTRWGSRRLPESEESMVLFVDHEVVTLHGRDARGQKRDYQMAMTSASATGLMSWLEASAPGQGMQYSDDF